jgi:hypothetical protein
MSTVGPDDGREPTREEVDRMPGAVVLEFGSQG